MGITIETTVQATEWEPHKTPVAHWCHHSGSYKPYPVVICSAWHAGNDESVTIPDMVRLLNERESRSAISVRSLNIYLTKRMFKYLNKLKAPAAAYMETLGDLQQLILYLEERDGRKNR